MSSAIRNAERRMKRQARRRLGLCSECGETAVAGKGMCLRCAEKRVFVIDNVLTRRLLAKCKGATCQK